MVYILLIDWNKNHRINHLCKPLFILSGGPACDATFYNYPNQWTGGANGNFFINFPTTVSAWTVKVQFASAVNSLSVWNGASISCSGAICTFSNAGYNGPQNAGTSLTLGFQVNVKNRLLCLLKSHSNNSSNS